MKHKIMYLSATILIAIILYPKSLYSQSVIQDSKIFTSKGIVEIGGNFSYQYTSFVFQGSEYLNHNILSIMPYVGYFISDNFELGMNPIGFHRLWDSDYSTTYITMLVAPAYNFKTDGNIFPFIEAQIGYTAQIASESGASSQTNDGFSWGGRAGIKYVVVSNGLLNLAIQYQQFKYNEMSSNTFEVSAGFTLWF